MCAWWSGQPVFGSGPVSKFVRENFTYIKPLIDLLSGSAVSQADLTKLHAIAATAAQVNRNANLPAIGNLGTLLETAGNKTVTLTFEPSAVIFICTNPDTPYGVFSLGFDDGTTHMCIYSWADMINNVITAYSGTKSIMIWHAGATPVRDAYISSKSATGFVLTVAIAGADTNYPGIYLALP
jgi:hypothetical protein